MQRLYAFLFLITSHAGAIGTPEVERKFMGAVVAMPKVTSAQVAAFLAELPATFESSPSVEQAQQDGDQKQQQQKTKSTKSSQRKELKRTSSSLSKTSVAVALLKAEEGAFDKDPFASDNE